jgi:ribonuclease J
MVAKKKLKLMHNLVRPKFFVPVHGEYRHLVKHALLAESLGMPKKNILIAENGSIIEVSPDKITTNGHVQAGKVLIDGLGVGDVGNIVLRDRKQLSQDGVIIVVIGMDKASGRVVSGPDLVSRGFVYVRESEDLMDQAKAKFKLLWINAKMKILKNGLPLKAPLGMRWAASCLKKPEGDR